jgi:hypothetical protein
MKKTHQRTGMKGLFLIILFLFISFSAEAAVWQNKNTWNDRWERQYQQWVQKNWTPDKFMNPKNPHYFLIAHDCADAVYLMRLIFSYENKLPFVIHDPARPSRLISNKMKKWDRVPKGNKRLREFINYINLKVGTRSIANDTFPVALSDIKPGDVYVTPGTHSYQIAGITETGVPIIMSSTTPASPKMLARLTSFPFFVPEDKRKRDGYRRFIQPQNIRKAIHRQPGYSDEQYRVAARTNYNFIYFTDVMAKKLGKRPETQEEKSNRLINALCAFAQERTNYVTTAVYYMENIRKHMKRRCMDRSEYDYYSTPSRDKRLKRFFQEVRNAAFSKGQRSNPNEWSAKRVAKAIFEPKPNARDLRDMRFFCQVHTMEDSRQTLSLRQLWLNLARGLVSSDPNAPMEARWGLVKRPYKQECRRY